LSDKFSEEIPELWQSHLDHLTNSAISTEIIRERGYRSIMGKLQLKEAGFSKAQQRRIGILIPLHGVDGKIVGYQYRPDTPRKNAKGKPIKYENPANSSVRLDVPPRCRQQLGDPKTSVWFTEGVKKVDALATQGACAVGLVGVWGFRGRNPLGGTTILADFDYIALKDRLAYLVFDSDSLSNPHVALALQRLSEHLKRKGAKARIIKLPAGAEGEKVGVDDYLAQGHNLKDLTGLEVVEEAPQPSLRDKSHEAYCINEGRICWTRQTNTGPVEVSLCNFTAGVTEDILKDDGQEVSRIFKVRGALGNGQPLPPIEVPASSFASLNWVMSEWGLSAIITAGTTYKDRLREAIQLLSEEAARKVVYAHTGWRVIDGELTFLTAGGALDRDNVAVELETPLQRYNLPAPGSDPKEAIAASLRFLEIGEPAVIWPLWASMFLAPLSELLCPAFTLWLVGPSGSFKSTVVALALCHYGEFTVRTLPVSWRDTANYLEKQMALAKDIPLVVDDWAPAQDMARAREYEAKAEQVARAQGNRMGRGRLRADTSSRAKYIPRGLLVSTGEQLPSGQSHTARLFSLEMELNSINPGKLTQAQQEAFLYPQAMSNYILWLKESWEDISGGLPKAWEGWRNQARAESRHPRLPEAVAWLYASFNLALDFAEERGGLDHGKAEEHREEAWKILVELAANQGGRVEEERPGRRFIEPLRSLVDQGRAVFAHKDDEAPRKAVPAEMVIGWETKDGYYLLDPQAAFAAVHDFCQRTGAPFTFKPNAVWKDLKRLNYIECSNGRTSDVAWIYGQSKRVIKLKKRALDEA
jgi:hypothetical protein